MKYKVNSILDNKQPFKHTAKMVFKLVKQKIDVKPHWIRQHGRLLQAFSLNAINTKISTITVNPEIFARSLFSRIALKYIFVALKFHD